MPSVVKGQRCFFHPGLGSGRTQCQESRTQPLHLRFIGKVISAYDNHPFCSPGGDPVPGNDHGLGRGCAGCIDLGVGSPGPDKLGHMAMTHGEGLKDKTFIEPV